MRIGAIIPDIGDGTSYYRGAGPLNQITRTNKDIEVVYMNECNWATLGACDLVFMQRPCDQSHINVFNMVKDQGIPVICDWDDDLFNLHPCNGAYASYNDPTRQNNIKWMIMHADKVICSTDYLSKKYSKYRKKDINVIPNAFNDLVQYYVSPFPRPREFDIAYWRGGPQHEVDLDAHMDEMVEVVNTTEIPWVIMGNPPWRWTFKLIASKWEHKQTDDVIKYLKNLYQLNPLVGVAPLAKIEFNFSKSNIGWIEATTSGAAYIAPSFHDEFNKPGVLRYDNDKTIKTLFHDVVKDRGQAESNRRDSWNYIMDCLRLSHVNKKRVELFNEYR